MPRLFEGLLVSTRRNFEQNAASEIFYTLTKELEINGDQIKTKNTGISGLITVQLLSSDLNDVMEKLIKLEEENAYFIHCLKIRPIGHVLTSELDLLQKYVEENAHLIQGKFKIVISKRHNPIRSQEIIASVASVITAEVDLDNPQTIILVEVLGDKMGVSIIPSSHIYSTQKVHEDLNNQENWFLS